MSINMRICIGIFVVACNGVNSVDAFFPSHHHTIRHRSGRVDAVNNSERSVGHPSNPGRRTDSGQILFGATVSADHDLSVTDRNTADTFISNDVSDTSSGGGSSGGDMSREEVKEEVSFSHIHIYVDDIQDIGVYKRLEQQVTEFANRSDPYRSHSDTSIDAHNNNADINTHDTTTTTTTTVRLQRAMSKGMDVQACRPVWSDILTNRSSTTTDTQHTHTHKHTHANTEQAFIPQNRDVIKQLIMGLGFRVTGMRYGDATRSLLLTTRDPGGVQFVVSSLHTHDHDHHGDHHMHDHHAARTQALHNQHGDHHSRQDGYDHFDAATIKQFYNLHSDRQGIASLAFEISSGTIEAVHARYTQFHPQLLTDECRDGVIEYHTAPTNATATATGDGDDDDDENGGTTTTVTKVLEVFAYYRGEKGGEADHGTRLRFVQTVPGSGTGGEVGDGNGDNDGDNDNDGEGRFCALPGLEPVHAVFDSTCLPAYFDHWVSNVVNREGFIETLEETLGFTPKVDFNAGVVAAGEAQIESTVTGNDSSFSALQREFALRDQSQVYLPINNAVTEVGHVHGFLEEVGQGIQHIASRVDDLAAFVQRGNDFRTITGEGFTFLKIPRSYYGVLTIGHLTHGGQPGATQTQPTLSPSCAFAVMDACERTKITTPDAAVDLTLSRDEISLRLHSAIDHQSLPEFHAHTNQIIDSILTSRYSNLYGLLGDAIPTDQYIAIT